ncbi:hypothetical protein BKN38_07185 [Helicobacter sp. CLO-3]|uniref:class I SAM-dependent methyltransferase n=1 Tax=unclassified Helicobacter TaxID=2593540 RepID=UPI0008DA3132|nr:MULTISPECIES: methyltransferase domain-containing protein [unclassified Helicobacter]OHU82434.1 hypothetical protein BKN38_07185 [Helicobacter sp. CLO-3]
MGMKQKLKNFRDRLLGGGGVAHIASEVHFIKNLLLKQNENNLGALFDTIYEANMWGNGSGSGSNEILCKDYVAFLQDFFKKHDIKSVVDAGCGDWQFSKNIDFSGIDYKGFDVASFVIKANNAKYQKPNVTFTQYNGDFTTLPSADLLLCKDVLQHLPNAKIQEFVSILPKFKYALITNDMGDKNNNDILPTYGRTLDLRAEPFNVPLEIVFKIQESAEWMKANNVTKITMLWVNPNN